MKTDALLAALSCKVVEAGLKESCWNHSPLLKGQRASAAVAVADFPLGRCFFNVIHFLTRRRAWQPSEVLSCLPVSTLWTGIL